jgi:methyl-accepting chemotaxis protein
MKLSMNLKLWQRIALLITIGVLPMVVITLGVITISINKDIDFGRSEKMGINYQRPLEHILQVTIELKEQYAREETGSSGAQSEASFGKADQALRELQSVDNLYGADLQFTPDGLASRGRQAASVASLKREWEQIRAQDRQTLRNGGCFDDFIAHVRLAISQAGDTSNLILDPDLDSYYLMDVILCSLPQNQERLGKIVPQVTEWLRTDTIRAHMLDLAVMTALMNEADLNRIEGDVQTTLKEDANFYGTSPSLQASLPKDSARYLETNRRLLELLNQMSKGGKPPSAASFKAEADQAQTEGFLFWESSARELDHLLDLRLASYQQKRGVSLLLTLAALLLSGAMTWVFVRNLNKTLRNVSDALGHNSDNLAGIVSRVTDSSHAVAAGASSQAASTEETSASLEEMASMAKSNVEHSEKVGELVNAALEEANKGESQLRGLSAAMAELKTASADTSKIIKTIDEIAFQTNILALNAAVEAARAGDAGLGFSVVAEEVRALALRSSQAAKETADQIERTIASAENGTAISSKVEAHLRQMLTRVQAIEALAREVITASREQSQGIDQISQAVFNIDKVVQANATNAEESSSAANELEKQSRDLNDSVHAMIALLDGNRHQN